MIRPLRFDAGRPFDTGQEAGWVSISHCLRELHQDNQGSISQVGQGLYHSLYFAGRKQLMSQAYPTLLRSFHIFRRATAAALRASKADCTAS